MMIIAGYYYNRLTINCLSNSILNFKQYYVCVSFQFQKMNFFLVAAIPRNAVHTYLVIFLRIRIIIFSSTSVTDTDSCDLFLL